MPNTKYRFNKKSLQFEKAGIPWVSHLITLLGLFIVAAILFVGLVLLQNKVVESKHETHLRLQNEALDKHKKLIQSDITEASFLLTSLKEEDNKLYKRIYLTDKASQKNQSNYSMVMLEADEDQFDHALKQVTLKAAYSNRRANYRNFQLAQLYWPKKNDVEDFGTYPTRAPIKNFTLKSLACGFGEQINPYNKLLYQHTGVDIVADRGSDIVAPGNGKVVAVYSSALPAGYGNYIEIDHGNGYRTRFAHLETILVNRGQKVNKGEVIGTVGISGGAVAPHVHYEVVLNGKEMNPVHFMIEGMDEQFHHNLLAAAKK